MKNSTRNIDYLLKRGESTEISLMALDGNEVVRDYPIDTSRVSLTRGKEVTLNSRVSEPCFAVSIDLLAQTNELLAYERAQSRANTFLIEEVLGHSARVVPCTLKFNRGYKPEGMEEVPPVFL